MKWLNISNDVRMWYLWEYIHFPKNIMLLFFIQTQGLDFFHCIQRLSFSLANEVDISKRAMPYFLLEFVSIHRCLLILLQLKVKITKRISFVLYFLQYTYGKTLLNLPIRLVGTNCDWKFINRPLFCNNVKDT